MGNDMPEIYNGSCVVLLLMILDPLVLHPYTTEHLKDGRVM